MSQLYNRREKVSRLTNLALQDRNPVKYFQGRHILSEIDKRINKAENFRTLFINQLKTN